MPEKKSNMACSSIGSSLLLVIFLILSLVMVATLSVTTARNNYLISEREAERVTAKTAANNASEEILAALPSLCEEASEVSSQNVTTSAGKISVEITKEGAYTVFSWEIPFSDSQALSVSVNLESPDEPENYIITRWQSVTTAEWSSDDTIQLLTP